MNLQVLLPEQILINEPVTRVLAEGINGWFCLLPRHLDMVAPLIPGMLIYHDLDKKEQFLAIDRGTLVKCGEQVYVSVQHGIKSTELSIVKQQVQEWFQDRKKHQEAVLSTMTRLEAGLVRQLLELERDV